MKYNMEGTGTTLALFSRALRRVCATRIENIISASLRRGRSFSGLGSREL
jgi:hypothetical protein